MLNNALVSLAGTVVILLLFLLGSINWKPEWVGELPISWNRANIVSFIAGGILSFASICLIHPILNLRYGLAVSFTMGILGYLFTQSLHTDVKARLVDGRLQYIALVIITVVNTLYLKQEEYGNVIINIMYVFILLSIALRFLISPFVNGFGAADFRSLAVLSAAVIPLAEPNSLIVSLSGFTILAIIYSLVNLVIKHRDEKVKAFTYLLLKASVPAVPLMLFPGIVVIIPYLFK